MYVRDLAVRDLRCLAHTRMRFRLPDETGEEGLPFPNMNVLIGTNGGGKSTVLKAIALGIVGPEVAAEAADLLPAGLIRRDGRRRCSIRVGLKLHDEDRPPGRPVPLEPVKVVSIELQGSGERIRFERDETAVDDAGPSPACPLLLGYGATRVAGRSPEDERLALPAQRIASLLLGRPTLVSLETWFHELSKPRREELTRLVDGLLPPDTRFLGKSHEGRYLFEHRGVAVPADAISDGYQALLSWVIDLLFHLTAVTPANRRVTETTGVVLVDEVDQRLHPRWQQWLVPAIAGSFPRLQFVCTSHSPLIAASLDYRNLLVMEPDAEAPGEGAYRVRRIHEQLSGRTVDRVLQSSFFELESTRGDPFRAELREIAARARKGDREAAVRFLRALAGLE